VVSADLVVGLFVLAGGGLFYVLPSVLAARRQRPDLPQILLRNVYGWFERIQRGTYGLTLSGITAISGGEPAVHDATLLGPLIASRT